MENAEIRPMRNDEIDLLEEFVYHAIFLRDGDPPPPRGIIEEPPVAVYIREFGKPDDHCLVAECGGRVVGAVWTRILGGEVKGFGNIDDETPEFAISLLPGYRGQGIGTALMEAMIELLAGKGYKRASLAVQQDNYAVNMYQKVGFEIIGKTEEEYIMAVWLR